MQGAQRGNHIAAVQFFMMAFASVGAPYHLMLSASAGLLMTGPGASALPWVYLGVAALTPVALFAFRRASRKRSITEIVMWSLGLRILIALALKGALWAGLPQATFIASIWARLDFILAGALLIGYGRSHFSDPRQLTSALAFGIPLSLLVGGALIPLALTTLAVEDLFVVTALMLAIAVPPLLAGQPGRNAPRQRAQTAVARPLSASFRWYFVVVMIVMGASASSHYLLDAVFLTATFSVMPDAISIARAVSLALAIGGGIALVVRWLGITLSHHWSGPMAALALSPFVLALIAGFGWILQGGLTGGWVWLGALGAMKAVEMALTIAIWRPAYGDLFRLIPEPQDRKARLFADGIAHPAGGALAAVGLLIWALPTLAGLAPLEVSDASAATTEATDIAATVLTPLAYILFGALSVWLFVTLIAGLGYRRMLSNALARNQSFQTDRRAAGTDRKAREMIQQRLASKDTEEVVGAARLQAALDPRGFLNTAPRLIAHGEASMVRQLLETVEGAQRPELFPPMAGRLTVEEDEGLRDALLTAAAATGHKNSPRLLARALAAKPDSPPLGALIGLGRHGGPFGVAVAAQFLESYAARGDEALRKTLDAVTRIGHGAPPAPVAEGLRSDDPKLRQMAIRAAGRCGDASLTSLLIERLAERRERRAASQALISIGPGSIEMLAAAIGDRALPEPQRMAAVTALGAIDSPQARERLFFHLESRSLNLRATVHLALWRAGAVAPKEAGPALAERSRQMMRNAAETMLANCQLAELDAPLLNNSLALRADKSIRRAIRAAGLTKKRKKQSGQQLSALFRAQDGTDTALSLAKTLLPADLAKLTDHVGKTDENSAKALRLHLGEAPETIDDWLHHILLTAPWATDWLRALAFDQLAKRTPDTIKEVTERLENVGPLLAETMTARTEGHSTMSLSIIEKVLILKSVDLFHQVPDEDLADIAPYLSSIYFDAGDHVMRKGDVGDELYVVVGGEVEIRRADGEKVRLGEKAVFGDLAALDPEPRVADVIAATPTHVLALSNDQLLSLFESNTEIASGVISALVGRLRHAEKY
ncbi:MAG: cyclic nucleotide-binding domain-containing protein [Pikeienuella sp.]